MKITDASILLMAASLALVACDDKKGAEGGAKAESKETSDKASEDGPILDKKIDELTAEDLAEAAEKLGYEVKSKSKSGSIVTVLGTKDKERLTFTHYSFEDEKKAEERAEISEKNAAAAKVAGTAVLVVKVSDDGKDDADKAKEILGRVSS